MQQALERAQELVRSSDWKGAFKMYVDLIDKYPDNDEARQRVEKLLWEARSNASRMDRETVSQLRPDLERAANKNVVQAMLILGAYSRESDPSTALKWFEMVAGKGSAPAMIEAGLLYSNHGQPEDYKRALEYFEQAAEAGDRLGKYLVGECYYFGKGVVSDTEKAVEYLKEAAALREPRAMDLLGTYYRERHQFDQARHYFEDAADAGYALSLSNLGVLYMNGEGVVKSPETASGLFKQAAEKGDPTGMRFYAISLYDGMGLAKDVYAATEWFRKSAKAGDKRAIKWCLENAVSLQ